MSLREVEKALGMGTPARDGHVYRTEYRNVDVVVREEGRNTITEYITPRGTLRSVQGVSKGQASAGIIGKHPVEFPLKTEKDYRVWMYVLENTVFVPTYEEYRAYDREVGDDGLPMVGVGDVPFHWWLQALAGYENGYLHLADFRDTVDALLKAMAEKDREMWKLVAESPARLVLHGLHLSSQFTPPRYFDRYITPYYKEFTKVLHTVGKSLAMHADNDTSAILGRLKEAGFDMVECFVTTPMVKTTLKEARDAWGTSIIIWGGVPSVILEESYPERQFEAYMRDLFRTIAPGDAFIMGIADNAMGTSMLSRVERITEMVERYGCYPVKGW
jgi:uroporphyrinogen-III decarboxylase